MHRYSLSHTHCSLLLLVTEGQQKDSERDQERWERECTAACVRAGNHTQLNTHQGKVKWMSVYDKASSLVKPGTDTCAECDRRTHSYSYVVPHHCCYCILLDVPQPVTSGGRQGSKTGVCILICACQTHVQFLVN